MAGGDTIYLDSICRLDMQPTGDSLSFAIRDIIATQCIQGAGVIQDAGGIPAIGGADPAEVFGHLTVLAPTAAPVVQAAARPLTEATTTQAATRAILPGGNRPGNSLPGDTIAFHLAALALLVAYCAALLTYRASVAPLLRILGSRLHTDKILVEHNFVFKRFIATMTLVGIAAMLLVGMRLAEVAGVAVCNCPLPAWLGHTVLPVLAAAIAFVFLYRRIVLGVSGWLVRSSDFTADVLYLTRIIFVIAVLVFTPLLVPLALDRGYAAGIALAAVLAAGAAAGAGLLIYKTFNLFISRKVSILHWILYLCAVEVFPISLVVLLAIR